MRLIDAEKLKRAIDECYEYEFPTASGAFDEFAKFLVPNIIEQQPTVTEWISVSERLPEEAGEYIIAQEVYSISEPSKLLKTDATTAYFKDGKFNRNKYFKVVAWMPIPEYKGEVE